MPGKKSIGRTLFYSIAKHITGGGKLQEARAGVDYIKVNFHTDNFAIIDKVIDLLAPLSEIDHASRNELCGLYTDVYSFLRYGYAVHAKLGVKATDDTQDHFLQPQEHETQQIAAYEALEDWLQNQIHLMSQLHNRQNRYKTNLFTVHRKQEC